MNEDFTQDQRYEHYRFVADKGQRPLRIDRFLVDRIENASRTKVQDAAHASNILVNQQAVKPNYKVKPGDEIRVLLDYPPREVEIVPQEIPLDIIFEDDYIIVINKQPGLVVHPGYGNYDGTLVNALAWHLKGNPLFDGQDMRPGLVHRLDKNTSGLMVIAKTEETKMHLANQFFHKTARRTYQALVWGRFDQVQGTIDGHLGRSFKNRKVMRVFPNGEYGKPAITHYKVLEHLDYVSLLELKLETGRTHQIRAHTKFIGHPVFNDPEYGGDQILKGTTFTKYKQFVQNCFRMLPRQALHAKSLGLVHPVSGESLYFDTGLPGDMQQVLDRWRHYLKNRKRDEH